MDSSENPFYDRVLKGHKKIEAHSPTLAQLGARPNWFNNLKRFPSTSSG